MVLKSKPHCQFKGIASRSRATARSTSTSNPQSNAIPIKGSQDMTNTLQMLTPEQVQENVSIAKRGIWTRANATANPKAYILNTGYMTQGNFDTTNAYNQALAKAKAWARA